MDQQQENNQAEKKPIKVTDEELIETSNVILNEITEKYKLNERKLRNIISKCSIITENSNKTFGELYKVNIKNAINTCS